MSMVNEPTRANVSTSQSSKSVVHTAVVESTFGSKWRKRAGVEPTKDRLAASLGFEVRTPHRGRFSSLYRIGRMDQGSEQVQILRVGSAHVAFVDGDAMPIQEIEDLDGDLPAVFDTVAKLRRREDAVVGMR